MTTEEYNNESSALLPMPIIFSYQHRLLPCSLASNSKLAVISASDFKYAYRNHNSNANIKHIGTHTHNYIPNDINMCMNVVKLHSNNNSAKTINQNIEYEIENKKVKKKYCIHASESTTQ